jgi:hypothetical protein
MLDFHLVEGEIASLVSLLAVFEAPYDVIQVETFSFSLDH